MKYFDDRGRRVPTNDVRVFADEASDYYRLEQPDFNYGGVLERSEKFNIAPSALSVSQFQIKAQSLLDIINSNDDFSGLLRGVHVPFVYKHTATESDLGANFQDIILPNVQKSFNDRFPDSHFKAVLQSDTELNGNISLDPLSGYDEFLDASQQGVVGWYFPQALQEYDIKSQRSQMNGLPNLDGAGLCLSGGMDIGAALIGTPELLVSEEFYTPILCMSAFTHSDERMILLLKSYGPHLEFWCMTQMLSKHTTQVSEQWAGGFTVFAKI